MGSRTRRGTTARVLTAAGVAVGVVLVAGGVTAYASTRSDVPTYRTATVSTQTVQQVLQATGTIEPGASATVTFPVSGTVASVRVAMGDRVRAGAVLATLGTTALRSAVASAQQGVAQAALTLHQAKTGQSSSTGSGSSSTSARSSGSGGSSAALGKTQKRLLGSVHQVDLALAAAKADLATAAVLCGSPATPPASAPPPAAPAGAAAPTTCAQAQQLVLADETRILRLQQGVSAQEAALDRLLAQASKQSTGSGGSGGSGGSTGTTVVSAAQLAADQAAVDAAAAQLAVAKQNLAQAVMVSPIAGVVASVGVTVGGTATAGSASNAVVVVDVDTHTVSVAVDVAKVPLVKVGQQATVVPDGTGKPLDATVAYVAAAPSTTGGSSYVVRLAFGADTTGLRDGIQAAVTLFVAQASDALSVPTSAVRHLGSLTYVLVLDGGTQKRQLVTVGAVGPVYTQIVQGLATGQLVVLADVDAAIPTSTTNNRFSRFAGAGGLGGLGGTGGFVPAPGGGRG